MRLLLDTHVVLWQLSGSRSLGVRDRQLLGAATDLAFSVVSSAEIGVKAALGKLELPDDMYAYVLDTGVRVLGLSPDHGLAVASLPLHHRDPFGRQIEGHVRTHAYSCGPPGSV